MKTRRYYNDAELVGLYKAHLLSYIEYRTPAVYHALRKDLDKLDNIQTGFLRNIGVDEVEALIHFNLAPLCMRRDIAMLGVLHRAAIGEGPPQLKEVFRRRPGSYMLLDPFDNATRHSLIKRSALGLIPVYNRLRSGAQSIRTVQDFQKYLQERAKKLIVQGETDRWMQMYSPRRVL